MASGSSGPPGLENGSPRPTGLENSASRPLAQNNGASVLSGLMRGVSPRPSYHGNGPSSSERGLFGLERGSSRLSGHESGPSSIERGSSVRERGSPRPPVVGRRPSVPVSESYRHPGFESGSSSPPSLEDGRSFSVESGFSSPPGLESPEPDLILQAQMRNLHLSDDDQAGVLPGVQHGAPPGVQPGAQPGVPPVLAPVSPQPLLPSQRAQLLRPHVEAAVPGLIDQGIVIHGSIQQVQLAIPPPPQNPPPPPPPGVVDLLPELPANLVAHNPPLYADLITLQQHQVLAGMPRINRSDSSTQYSPVPRDIRANQFDQYIANMERMNVGFRPAQRSPPRVPAFAYRHPNVPDWQTTKCRIAERGRHLFETGLWSDCEFIVGVAPNIKIFHCHKMFLAMASPVFEAMFYGGLAETAREIKISDVQPDAFSAMLEYVYTDEVSLQSFELVCDICYAAKKYMLPDLVEECTQFLWRDLYPKNACRAYEFAKLFEEPVLLDKSIQIMTHQTLEIVSEQTWFEVEHSTIKILLTRDTLAAPEAILFDAIDRWAAKECDRNGVENSPERKRTVLGELLFLIRYLTFTAAEFAAGPAKSGLLTQKESFAVLMNISCPGSWDLPPYMNNITESRKDPGKQVDREIDIGTKLWCKRAMMQEPHCLNSSILDCSVTFTVDRDVWIHGIEVPSQVTDAPEIRPNLEGVALMPPSPEGYNELLYAHLLDSDGSRLTYTHFTAKVNWNSMIEIGFNRSVKILPNRVYRIGMVLNKVGWYPMGVCTRRVSCEGCFFTFCVGQPNDTLRDGLIRSIIFS